MISNTTAYTLVGLAYFLFFVATYIVFSFLG